MERPELRPCPFCGSSDISMYECFGSDKGYHAQCEECGAEGPRASDEEGAARRWNVLPRLCETVALPLDEDGVPVCIGETVFLCDGEGYKVDSLTMVSDGWLVKLNIPGRNCGVISCRPSSVTHKEPDSLEAIEKQVYHLVMSEYLDDPEGDVKAVMERIKKLMEDAE